MSKKKTATSETVTVDAEVQEQALIPTIVQQVDLTDGLNIIAQAAAQGNLNYLVDVGHTLIAQGQMRGKLLAKLLFEIDQNWALLAQQGGIESEREEWLAQEFNISQQTIAKYTGMWKRLFGPESSVPEQFKPALLDGPTEHLLLAAPLAEDQPTKREWQKIVEAIGDKSALREIIQVKRGSRTSSKTALKLSVDKTSGQITAWRGKEKPVVIGVLKIKAKEQLAQDAIDRVIRAAGIMRK